jgi:hypothetical protein
MKTTHPLTEMKWSPEKKFLSILFMSYLFFYMFPFPLDQIPGPSIIAAFYDNIITFLTDIIGKNILRIPSFHRIISTGSGDTLFDYVRLITYAVLALITAMIVYFADSKRTNYDRLHYWFIVYARYYLGLYLIVYGLFKLVEGQFMFHDFGRLEGTFGDATPMGLLWTFMGHSKVYGGFTGLMEAGAGFLILFSNTKTLGALLSVAVMSNVVLLNFCFDVPVKLFSSHLLLISIIILAPNLRILYNFFVLNKTETLNHCKLVFENKWKVRTRAFGKGILILGFSAFILVTGINGMLEYGSLSPKKSIDGSYHAVLFYNSENDSLKEIADKDIRWKRMNISSGYGTITNEAGKTKYYETTVDTLKKTITFKESKDTTNVSTMAYEQRNPKYIILKGNFEKSNLQIEFSKKNIEDYRLVNTKFHWIQAYPNNQ